MKIFAIVIIYLSLLIGFLHPVNAINQDLGRHLATGDIILNSGSIPKTNLFSYTYPNFPFVNHHWLSEVIYTLLFNVIGFNGLLTVNTALIAASISLLIASVYKKSAPITLLFLFALYLPILFERTDVRPEAFSFLFLSLFIYVLYKNKEKFTKLIFLLPLIEFLWVNIHIYFPLGIITAGFFFIDSLIMKKLSRQTLILGIVFLLSIFITTINPNGLKGSLYPLSIFDNYGYSIEENQNIFFLWSMFQKQSILFFFIAAGTLWTILLLNFKKIQPAEWFISIFFTVFAAISVRNLPLFAITTTIPFLKHASNIKVNLSKKITILAYIFFLIIFFYLTREAYSKNSFGFGIDEAAKNGVDFFIQKDLKGPIFNNFDIGSYLEYRLYPKEKVFVDGRPEAYPSTFFQNVYIPMQLDEKKFNSADEEYNFNTIFFSYTDQTPWGQSFLNKIVQNDNWNLAYLDDYIVIFTKNKNMAPLIKTNYSNLKSLARLAFFFQNKNFIEEEIKVYQKILLIDSDFCPALYSLAFRLKEKNDPSFPIFENKFLNNCR